MRGRVRERFGCSDAMFIPLCIALSFRRPDNVLYFKILVFEMSAAGHIGHYKSMFRRPRLGVGWWI